MAQIQEISQPPTLTLTPNAFKGVAATELRPWGSFTILEYSR